MKQNRSKGEAEIIRKRYGAKNKPAMQPLLVMLFTKPRPFVLDGSIGRSSCLCGEDFPARTCLCRSAHPAPPPTHRLQEVPEDPVRIQTL